MHAIGAEGPTKSSELEAEIGWNKRVQDDVEHALKKKQNKGDMRDEID